MRLNDSISVPAQRRAPSHASQQPRVCPGHASTTEHPKPVGAVRAGLDHLTDLGAASAFRRHRRTRHWPDAGRPAPYLQPPNHGARVCTLPTRRRRDPSVRERKRYRGRLRYGRLRATHPPVTISEDAMATSTPAGLDDALRRFDRSSTTHRVSAPKERAEQIKSDFPLDGWQSMALERYALGHSGYKCGRLRNRLSA